MRRRGRASHPLGRAQVGTAVSRGEAPGRKALLCRGDHKEISEAEGKEVTGRRKPGKAETHCGALGFGFFFKIALIYF